MAKLTIGQKLLSRERNIAFVEAAIKRKGCKYVWPCKANNYSGKDLKGALYPNTYDCSGLITSALYEGTGQAIDRRATWNAAKLFNNCALVDTPEMGSLCFYGPSRGVITHVMLWVGLKQPGMTGKGCFGASGGDSRTVTPAIADKMDASVKIYKTHLYRKDFIAFGNLVTNDD